MTPNQTYSTLSNILSPSTFRKIIVDRDFTLFSKKIGKHDKLINIPRNATNGEALKSLYNYLLNNYRNEFFYKNILLNKLIDERKFESTIIFNEFRINKSIADTIFINGEPVLYEIKTELDNPDKLLSQIEDYRKAFAKIFVVTHHSLYYKYYSIIKNMNIGLVFLNSNNQLVEYKSASPEYRHLDHAVLFKLLRKSEYSKIVVDNYGYLPDVPNTKYFASCLTLVKALPILDFYRQVHNTLKMRINNNSPYVQNPKIPQELKYICYLLNMNQSTYLELNSFLQLSFKA